MEARITVHHQQGTRQFVCTAGEPIAHLLRDEGLLPLPCGLGKCGKCLIYADTEPADEERTLLGERRLAAGLRLACHTRARDGLEVTVPHAGTLKVLTQFTSMEYVWEPLVRRVPLAVDGQYPAVDVAVADRMHLYAAQTHVRAQAEDDPLKRVGGGVGHPEVIVVDEHPVPGLPVVQDLGPADDVDPGVELHHAGEAAQVGHPDALLDREGPPEVLYVVGGNIGGLGAAQVRPEVQQAPLHVVAVGPQGALLAVYGPEVVYPFVCLGHRETCLRLLHDRVSVASGTFETCRCSEIPDIHSPADR